MALEQKGNRVYSGLTTDRPNSLPRGSFFIDVESGDVDVSLNDGSLKPIGSSNGNGGASEIVIENAYYALNYIEVGGGFLSGVGMLESQQYQTEGSIQKVLGVDFQEPTQSGGEPSLNELEGVTFYRKKATNTGSISDYDEIVGEERDYILRNHTNESMEIIGVLDISQIMQSQEPLIIPYGKCVILTSMTENGAGFAGILLDIERSYQLMSSLQMFIESGGDARMALEVSNLTLGIKVFLPNMLGFPTGMGLYGMHVAYLSVDAMNLPQGGGNGDEQYVLGMLRVGDLIRTKMHITGGDIEPFDLISQTQPNNLDIDIEGKLIARPSEWGNLGGSQSNINLLGFANGTDGYHAEVMVHHDQYPSQWSAITYGNGLFVAVSRDGTYRTKVSSDGINWHYYQNTMGSWSGVAYGNGMFVAVGVGGSSRAMYSTDGRNWIISPSNPSYGNWTDVTYAVTAQGQGIFVAVGKHILEVTNYVMTSTDGINWTPQSVTGVSDWEGVTFGLGQFIAVASEGDHRIMSSTDGVNWVNVSVDNSPLLLDIAFGNNVFVAVGYVNGGYKYLHSNDGVNWIEAVVIQNPTYNSVAFGNGVFMMTSMDQVESPIAVINTVGVESTSLSVSDENGDIVYAQWTDIAFGDGMFIGLSASSMGAFRTTYGLARRFENIVNEYYVNNVRVHPSNKQLFLDAPRTYHIKRSTTDQGVTPTLIEIERPKKFDTAVICLGDNTIEYYTYDSGWTFDF